MLVPLADMVNHQVEGGYVNIDYDNKEFSVLAQRDYKAGEELFLSYGEMAAPGGGRELTVGWCRGQMQCTAAAGLRVSRGSKHTEMPQR